MIVVPISLMLLYSVCVCVCVCACVRSGGWGGGGGCILIMHKLMNIILPMLHNHTQLQNTLHNQSTHLPSPVNEQKQS